MNKIQAKITNIKKEKEVALIELKDKYENYFNVLMLDFKNIQTNTICNIVFKESEVMIAHKSSTKISTKNKFISKIIDIKQDCIFARITFDFCGIHICSIITKEQKEILNMHINDDFIWFVKENELILQF